MYTVLNTVLAAHFGEVLVRQLRRVQMDPVRNASFPNQSHFVIQQHSVHVGMFQAITGTVVSNGFQTFGAKMEPISPLGRSLGQCHQNFMPGSIATQQSTTCRTPWVGGAILAHPRWPEAIPPVPATSASQLSHPLCALSDNLRYLLEIMAATPPWKIAIVTSIDAGEDEYSEVKNALLYGDHTHWIALEAGLSALEQLVLNWEAEGQLASLDPSLAMPVSYTSFRESLKKWWC